MLGYLLLVMVSGLLLLAPRRYAALVFLGGVIFLNQGITVTLGFMHLMPARVLILVGLLRIVSRGEFHGLALTSMDKWIIALGPIFVVTSFFHQSLAATLIEEVGKTLDLLGSYCVCRCLLQHWDDLILCLKGWLLFMPPLALCMISEQRTGHNIFYSIAAVDYVPVIRHEAFRAEGPFRSSILGGTAAATLVPFAVLFWRTNKVLAMVALGSILAAVFCCHASGPIGTLAAGAFALWLWRYRAKLRIILWGFVALVCLLQMVMKSGVWFLIARVDFTGGSDSWHRAQLIDSSIKHVSEWWLTGTDYTRNWMPTGIRWSADQTDITNDFLAMGVAGGFPLMFCYIAGMGSCFRLLAKAIRSLSESRLDLQFSLWCFGCTLFAHIVSMIGVDYFDQSGAIFFATLGMFCSGSCATLAVPWPNHSELTGEPIETEPQRADL
jgi:hypothetical protein